MISVFKTILISFNYKGYYFSKQFLHVHVSEVFIISGRTKRIAAKGLFTGDALQIAQSN